jgi:transposase
MSAHHPDRCGGRVRRPSVPEPAEAPAVAAREEVRLSSLGQAFIDALRDDDRFRDIIADPWGEHGPATA